MRLSRKDVLSVARSFIGTPYVHEGRMGSIAFDCLGLIAGTCTRLGVHYEDKKGYTPSGVGPYNILDEFGKWFDPIPVYQTRPGDILVFWVTSRARPAHCAIKSDLGVIHTHSHLGKVVEHCVDEFWKKRLAQGFKFRGIQD